ncbi:uncharacterized protein BO95DRAFT_469176 [Aspergillus brunneoviolaceus CBS 621.78]|uniref:Uncharacterized protein n=1 Tax=Aspergillus brunneoviolaceus CBS 621.78 TaxID=1450534 RepID=A0ACD1FSR5_9EURO|nr:hypothetical protein BO95DRAFT_469176 [Aspergillus brunneoviolaceus CBS 621.78]RAH40026.1 hypothetical protein BO95DRAFT_469176 [Aspergillus brunneoviolaceus CBS 621.78]
MHNPNIPSSRLACTSTDAPNLYTWVNKTYKQSLTWTNAYIYLASPNYRARTKSTKYTFDFAPRWMGPTTGGTSGLYDDFAMVPASNDRFAVFNATTTGTTGRNVPDKLREFEVMFGVMRTRDGSRVAGLGVVKGRL